MSQGTASVEGKKLLVVGGCGGIGKAVVQAALQQGIAVAVFDLGKSIEAHRPPETVMAFAADATNKVEMDAAFQKLQKEWGGFDYLVNLAGFMTEFNPISDYSYAGWNEIMKGNLDSTFLACQAAIPLMNNGGAIVNMSSGLGFVGQASYGAYSASKAAIISLTKTLAKELAPGIRVNAVAPGAVQTAFLSGGLAHGGNEESPAKRLDVKAYEQVVPLGRIAQPTEVAAPIMFLLSDAASYITGQTLHINGGALMV